MKVKSSSSSVGTARFYFQFVDENWTFFRHSKFLKTHFPLSVEHFYLLFLSLGQDIKPLIIDQKHRKKKEKMYNKLYKSWLFSGYRGFNSHGKVANPVD